MVFYSAGTSRRAAEGPFCRGLSRGTEAGDPARSAPPMRGISACAIYSPPSRRRAAMEDVPVNLQLSMSSLCGRPLALAVFQHQDPVGEHGGAAALCTGWSSGAREQIPRPWPPSPRQRARRIVEQQNGAFFTSPRAMETRCFCPPERFTPPLPSLLIAVRHRLQKVAPAFRTAERSSRSERSGCPRPDCRVPRRRTASHAAGRSPHFPGSRRSQAYGCPFRQAGWHRCPCHTGGAGATPGWICRRPSDRSPRGSPPRQPERICSSRPGSRCRPGRKRSHPRIPPSPAAAQKTAPRKVVVTFHDFADSIARGLRTCEDIE